MINKNNVKLTGTIIGIWETVNTISVRLATDGGNNESSYPLVIFRDKELLDGFEEKDRVTIKGHFNTRVRQNKENGMLEFPCNIIGDLIEYTKRPLIQAFPDNEFETVTGGYPDDKNEVILAGTVQHVYQPRDSVTLLTLNVDDKGRKESNVEVVCFGPNADFASRLNEKERAAVVGIVKTKRDKNNNRNLQDVICKDVDRLGEIS
mgnify:FL=1|jgi:RecG-like helicase